MIELRWTEQAADDLTAIRDFIARESPAYAHAVIAQLYSSVGQLREFPESGRTVPEREQPDLRELIRPPYRVVYRYVAHAGIIEILTVFHAARLFPEHLR